MLDSLSNWKDKIVHEIETRFALLKLGIVERVSVLLGSFIFILICIFVFVAILIIAGLGVGEYFAGITGSDIQGYFIAAGIYLVLFFLLFLLRKPITRAFAGIFIRQLTNDKDDD